MANGPQRQRKKKKNNKIVSSLSSSSAAKKIKQKLPGAAVSKSSKTGVNPSGTLSKVANFIGRTAGVASKFIPGVPGTVAKVLSEVLNDPEWWQNNPGPEITCNETLRPIGLGDITDISATPNVSFSNVEAVTNRPAIGIFKTSSIVVTDNMMVQYVMPHVRNVINSVPLQPAADYKTALTAITELYAITKNLEKYRYLTRYGTTFLPSMDDTLFPILQVSNAAQLNALIDRCNNFLRSTVRLPHTMCEYLAWRFGRVYRSCDSAKAGVILHDILDVTNQVSVIEAHVTSLINTLTNSANVQKATADLFTVFKDHIQDVTVDEATQFRYDKKEFMLRTNASIFIGYAFVRHGSAAEKGPVFPMPNINTTLDPVVIDSDLDNRTVFMASTTSTAYDGNPPLFPVQGIGIYTYNGNSNLPTSIEGKTIRSTVTGSNWLYSNYGAMISFHGTSSTDAPNVPTYQPIFNQALADYKALDIYNKGLLLQYSTTVCSVSTSPLLLTAANINTYDVSALAIDTGITNDSTIATEQLYAFSNLMDINRRNHTTKGQAQNMVATEVANLIDDVDFVSVENI